MSKKNSKDTIGNRTRDLRACSAVPHIFGISRKLNKAKPFLYFHMLKVSARSSYISGGGGGGVGGGGGITFAHNDVPAPPSFKVNKLSLTK